jgi:hypothetical protein
VDELAATIRPAVVQVRRRAPEIVMGLAVLVTVLSGLAVMGSLVDDAAIDSNRATAQAEVLEGSTFLRTLVSFTMANGQAVVPERGVFHPRGLSAGQVVAVEYDVTDPELVRVAGRSTGAGVWPLVVTAAVGWAVLAPLSVWLRRRRARR